MADDFFGDDSFDSIVRQFFGGNNGSVRRVRNRIDSDEEDRESEIGFIEGNGRVFLIIEMPGFDEKDVAISVKDRTIEIFARKKSIDGIKDYLARKFKEGISIRRVLPSHVSSKKFSHTFRNGILEVAFDAK